MSSRRHIDSNSFDGVGVVLKDLYRPVFEDLDADQLLGQVSIVGLGVNPNSSIDQAASNGKKVDQACEQIEKAKGMIFEALVPALPRAAALKATVLGNQIDDALNIATDRHSHLSHASRWSANQARGFVAAQQSYSELVNIIEGFDNEAISRRKKDELHHRLQTKRRFEGTASSIAAQ